MLRGPSQRQTVRLRPFLNGLVADFASRMSSSSVTFEALTFADELEVDPRLLRRLLVSLIEHALRRAPDGTKVILVVSPAPIARNSGSRTKAPRYRWTRESECSPRRLSVNTSTGWRSPRADWWLRQRAGAFGSRIR